MLILERNWSKKNPTRTQSTVFFWIQLNSLEAAINLSVQSSFKYFLSALKDTM